MSYLLLTEIFANAFYVKFLQMQLLSARPYESCQNVERPARGDGR